MSGATSRRKGAEWERALAHWFTAHGFGDIRTGRSVTGGTQQGADLVTLHPDNSISFHVAGWSIEAKDHDRAAIAGWFNQAADDANGRPFAVIHKNRNRPTDQARVYLPAIHAEQLYQVRLPAECRHITVDLHLFTAALTCWNASNTAA